MASGELSEQRKEIIELCEKLQANLSHLSAEHQLIKAFVIELMQAATNENHPGMIEFEKELQKHANTEEDVFFPTAVIIGEYLKFKSL